MEEKRKLPSWMVGVKKAENSNASKTLDLDEDVSEFVKPKAKRVARKKLSSEKGVLVKCEIKRKKRGLGEKDGIESDGLDGEGVFEKKKRGRVGRKSEERDVLGKTKEERCELDGGNENQDPYPPCGEEYDDDDIELTMEDLLSIAKEFVENEKSDVGQKKPAEELKFRSKPSHTSSAKTGNSILIPQDNISHMHEETSHHDSVENTTSEVTLPDFKMTEDPTQDMLDLFLGPLLRKPIPNEVPSPVKDIRFSHEIRNQRHDAVTSNIPVTVTKKTIPKEVPGPVKDIPFSHEIKNQRHDVVISDKPVIMTKKKSRLREAVAMLLDC